MTMPSISIGMPVRNSAATIARCIASVLAQDFSDWELIVIDDGSTDGTSPIVRRFPDPRIRLITHTESRGLAKRLNQAVALSLGAYFARMDGDDIMYPERLRLQYDYLQANADVDLVGGGELVFKGDGSPLGVRCSTGAANLNCASPWRGIPLPHPTWMGRARWFQENPYPEELVRAQDQGLLLSSYRKSRFADVGEILIGYCEERRSPKMLLKVRYHAIRAYWRYRWSLWYGIMSVAWHAASCILDLSASILHVDRGILKRNTPSASAEQLRRWKEVWKLATADSQRPFETQDPSTASGGLI